MSSITTRMDVTANAQAGMSKSAERIWQNSEMKSRQLNGDLANDSVFSGPLINDPQGRFFKLD